MRSQKQTQTCKETQRLQVFRTRQKGPARTMWWAHQADRRQCCLQHMITYSDPEKVGLDGKGVIYAVFDVIP